MANKNTQSGKVIIPTPVVKSTKPQSITTLADFWPGRSEESKVFTVRRLGSAPKAITSPSVNKDPGAAPLPPGVTVTLASLNPPTKESEWYDAYCATCAAVMHIHRDWENPPRHCKDCREKQRARWIMRPCKKCKADMPVCKDWTNPPDRCDACRSSYRPKRVSCKVCHEKFEISVGLQIKAEEMGWKLPIRCKTCRELPKSPVQSAASAGRYLSHNISNRYKTSRVMSVRVRVFAGGSPSSGRRR